MFRRTIIAALLAASPALAQPVAVPDCTVDGVLADGDGLKLDVTYRCRASVPLSFQPTEDRAAQYVSDLKVEQRDGVAEAHYRFDLSGFARAVDSTSVAVLRGNGVLATLGGWLLEPRGYDRVPIIDIRMTTGPGLVFAAGLPKVGDAWRLSGTAVRFAGYTALGRLAYREFAVPAPGSLRPGQPKADAVLRVAILDGVNDAGRADLFDWAERTAEAEANYWQGFTARQALLGVVPVANKRGVGYGRTVSGGGVTVMVEVGTDVDRRRLFNDWVLTHELIHTGMPYIRGRGTWLMEGAATYVEPIIRARAGWKTEEEVWREWVENMPQGVEAFSTGLGQRLGPAELLGRRHLHAADRHRHPPRQQRREGSRRLPGRRAVDRTRRWAARQRRRLCRRLRPRHRHHRHEHAGRPPFQQGRARRSRRPLEGARHLGGRRPHRARRHGAFGAVAQDDRAGQPSAEAGEAAVGVLEHPVRIRRLLRDRLHDVPMLDDLAVLQPEDVDDGHAALAGFAHAMHVQDHIVALGEGPLDLALGARGTSPCAAR